MLQGHLEDPTSPLPPGVDDVQHTMAVIEAGYRAEAVGGVAPDYRP